MGKLLDRFRKFKTRERVLLIISIIVLFYIGIDRIVVTPFLKSINETKERLETQKKLLTKYHSFITNKKHYETRLTDLEQYYIELRDKFLSEKTEDIASAKLQDIIDELADKNGLDVTRSTVLKKEVINKAPYLIAISINVEINDIDSSQKLQNFLYSIEHNIDTLLFIDDIRIKTLGLSVIKGATVSSTFTAIASIENKS